MSEVIPDTDRTSVSRRSLLKSTSSAALALPLMSAESGRAAVAQPGGGNTGVNVELTVNGRAHRLVVDPRASLLDTLRERLSLTGSKKGCDHGQCGACTVHVGGKRVLSCLTLAVAVREPVTTIEGIANSDGTLHPMQTAFVEHDAFQCGYCTPGQIMSAIACVNEGHAGKADDIREWMSGNICRCAAYPHIVAAVEQGRKQMKGRKA